MKTKTRKSPNATRRRSGRTESSLRIRFQSFQQFQSFPAVDIGKNREGEPFDALNLGTAGTTGTFGTSSLMRSYVLLQRRSRIPENTGRERQAGARVAGDQQRHRDASVSAAPVSRLA